MDMIHSARLKDLVEIHVKEREEIKLKSVNEQQASAKRAEESGLYLDDVIIALEQRHTAAEQEIKTEYQQTHEEVRNKVLFVTKKKKHKRFDINLMICIL